MRGDGQLSLTFSGSATISADGLYRYDLIRPLVDPLPFEPRVVLICGLNPSTADARKDDQTIRQLRFFARREGGELLAMVNLYAYRSTQPAVLGMVADPVGPDNDDTLRAWSRRAALIIIAWGALGRDAQARAVSVLAILGETQGAELMCFGRTREGFPRHPSRLAHATQLSHVDQACAIGGRA